MQIDRNRQPSDAIPRETKVKPTQKVNPVTTGSRPDQRTAAKAKQKPRKENESGVDEYA